MSDDNQTNPMDENEHSTDEDFETDNGIAEHADEKIDALIQLLVKKGVISEQEFQDSYDDLYENSSEE